MTAKANNPFPTIDRLARECAAKWDSYALVAKQTAEGEETLRAALEKADAHERLLDSDSALILFGSYARHEVVEGSDYDWGFLVDGVVNAHHAEQARAIEVALKEAGLKSPGATGTFGNLFFSHELVHCIGGGADSNANLTRRMLMLLESRCINASSTDNALHVWRNVVSNILERYFEQDVHFRIDGKRRVPRFLLNDITRYWRTICVDYAAKHREQQGQKWALRNAKIRFSRKLLYAAGLAFCLSCELDPPQTAETLGTHDANVQLFIQAALKFADTPPLEYLAAFVEDFVQEPGRRRRISKKIFGAYAEWLILLNTRSDRETLESMQHDNAANDLLFQSIRKNGSEFASGLRELFFNRNEDPDPIANLSLDYVGF